MGCFKRWGRAKEFCAPAEVTMGKFIFPITYVIQYDNNNKD